MAYNVISGEIVNGVLYHVSGAQSISYNGNVYTFGQFFRGVSGIVDFTFSGSGTQQLNEVLEIQSGTVEFAAFSSEQPTYNETTSLNGFAIEFELNEAEKIVNEVMKLQGFALELIDYPFYSFEITEKRL